MLPHKVLPLFLLLVALFALSTAQITYELDGKEVTKQGVQLWYEGNWKVWDPVEAPLVVWPSENVSGMVVLVKKDQLPYDKTFRAISALNPAAIILANFPGGLAGGAMYSVDSKERDSITANIVETIGTEQEKDSIYQVPEGTMVRVVAGFNTWKRFHEGKFQFVWQLILGFLELGILTLATHRWYHFFLMTAGLNITSRFLAIGPLCMALQIIASLIRLAFVVYDPFWSYRYISHDGGNVLFSIHVPFMLTAGIVLTFFWAESLSNRSVKASPFISRYRVLAIVIIVILFVVEIITELSRLFWSSKAIDPSVVSAVVYFIVTLILTVCYFHCAVRILKRIGSKHRRIRIMSIQFTMSAVGYCALLTTEILIVAIPRHPVSTQLIFNLLYLSCSFISLLQILGMRPGSVHRSTAGTRSDTLSKGKTSHGAFQAGRHDYSRKKDDSQDIEAPATARNGKPSVQLSEMIEEAVDESTSSTSSVANLSPAHPDYGTQSESMPEEGSD